MAGFSLDCAGEYATVHADDHCNADRAVLRSPAKAALEQQDLLAVTAPLRVPEEIATVGGAVEWVLNPSGYRLVSSDQLSTEVKDLLNLPLPNAHRRFEALSIKDIIALLVGPAFVLVHDPVHRLMTFERCGDSAAADSQSPANSPKTPKSH